MTQDTAPPPNPFAPLIAGQLDVATPKSTSTSQLATISTHVKSLTNCLSNKQEQTAIVYSPIDSNNMGFILLKNCIHSHYKGLQPLTHCQNSAISAFIQLKNCTMVFSSALDKLDNSVSAFYHDIVRLYDRKRLDSSLLSFLQTDLSYAKYSVLLANPTDLITLDTIAVPCRHYPVPSPPPILPPVVGRVCKVRPPAHKLPLKFKKRHHIKEHIPSSHLPLIIACWHDEIKQTTPNLGAYIVHNSIVATLDDVAINPIGFTIKTDVHSYCWQGDIQLSHSDFLQIKDRLNQTKPNHQTKPTTLPLVRVVINGTAFAFMAENVAHHRSFAEFSHAINGRSSTAILGADFAHAQKGLIDQDSYASQLINSQLANLPFTCDFKVDDWLIPKNQLSITDKTPIAVIHDIATACGAFISSDKNDNRLIVAPKYKTPAWQMNTAKPDRIIPLDVIKSISEQARNHPPFNTVTIVSNVQGGIVYRQELAQDNMAPTFYSPLACDQIAIINKGKQILSDGGRHIDVSITMRWADKYNIALANLGEIWQINDTDGAWLGVVVSVAVDVKLDDGVPMVWQSVGLDRWVG